MSSFISSFENTKKYGLRLKHAVCFAILFVTLFTLCETANRHLIELKSKNFSILRDFEKNKEDVRTLFLGDSQILSALDAELFNGGAFNLSFYGANYIQSYYILKRYIDLMPKIKILILQVSLHSFSSFRSDRISEPLFWNRFIDYAELSEVKGSSVHTQKIHFTLLDSAYGRRFFLTNLRDFAAEKFLNSRTSGRAGFTDNLDTVRRRDLQDRVKFHFKNQDIFDRDLTVYFEKILNLCKERGVTVVTVQLPLSKKYAALANSYVTFGQIEKMELKDPLDKGLIYKNLDYFSAFYDRDDYFEKDGDHLNGKGREKFSELLRGDISEL